MTGGPLGTDACGPRHRCTSGATAIRSFRRSTEQARSFARNCDRALPSRAAACPHRDARGTEDRGIGGVGEEGRGRCHQGVGRV
jgi:hypothetical protein